MNDYPTDNTSVCEMNCDRQFRTCLNQGQEEVFCRIQRVPCESQCNERQA